MSDAIIFVVGLFVFLLLAGGLAVTFREFSKMGTREQKDLYPRTRPFNG
jgi:hypothetical protein